MAVTVGSGGVAVRVVGRLPQLAPKVRKVPCAVLLPAALSIRIERCVCVHGPQRSQMDPTDGVVEVQSDSEYEEWLPAVIKRWNAFEGGETNAKQYTAFLRFVFKAYSIPARVCIRWMIQNNRPRSNKCRVLQILYDGRARTMEEMRGNFKGDLGDHFGLPDTTRPRIPIQCQVQLFTNLGATGIKRPRVCTHGYVCRQGNHAVHASRAKRGYHQLLRSWRGANRRVWIVRERVGAYWHSGCGLAGIAWGVGLGSPSALVVAPAVLPVGRTVTRPVVSRRWL